MLCPNLTDPANGRVDVSGRTVGSLATYSCDEGFEENGLMVRVCGANGEWSGSDTECVDVTTVICPLLPDPLDGSVMIASRNFREMAIYSCNNDFTLVGPNFVRTCTVTAEWSGIPPTCERKFEKAHVEFPDPCRIASWAFSIEYNMT